MMSSPRPRSVAGMLTDFTPKLVPEDRVTVFTVGADRTAPSAAQTGASESVTELIDHEARVKEAFSAGRESGQIEASVLFDAEKTRLEREMQERMTAAETLFVEQMGARLEAQVSQGLDRVSGEVSRLLSVILTPLIEDEMRARTIGAFKGEVERLVSGLEAVDVVITGPSHLLDGLRKANDADADRFTLVEAEQAELSLKLDNVVVETRLGRFIDQLREHRR
ncbi:MAG: hypothetical protein ACRECY_02265 [Phyllobacterium sp.]